MSSSDSEQVLRATFDVPVECAFTKPGAMNGVPTYRAPPIPTIQGVLYAALGRPSLLRAVRWGGPEKSIRDQEESFRERVAADCEFGVRIVEPGIQHTSLRTRMKAETSKNDASFTRAPSQLETLISPTFRIYIGGPTALLTAFEAALTDPERLLYLGRSDDFVDIRDIEQLPVTRVTDSATLECVVPGADGDEVSLLPVEPDYRDGRSRRAARVRTVSLYGGPVEDYYTTPDGDQFTYLT